VTALALVALVVVAYLAIRRWSARFKPQIDPSRNPADVVAVAPAMVRIDHGLLAIGDYDAWFEVVPRAIRRALRSGNTDAESVLVEVFSSILPEQQWPPLAGSPHRWQWQQIVQRTAEILALEPSPTPTRRRDLHVVAPSARV